jgi:hypothetical protein
MIDLSVVMGLSNFLSLPKFFLIVFGGILENARSSENILFCDFCHALCGLVGGRIN